MAKKSKRTALSMEERLDAALVPDVEQPYWIPKNWCWVSLSSLVSLYNGDRGVNYPSKKDYVETGIPFINAGAIQDGRLDPAEYNYITQEKYDALRAGKIQINDILYCLRGSLGKTAIVDFESQGAISSSLCILRASPGISVKYLYYLLSSDTIVNQQEFAENGSAQPNLSAASVLRYMVPLPPLAEQQRIVDRIERLFAKLDEAKEKAQAVVDGFEDRKAAILHKAFTGELIGLSDCNTVALESIVETIRIGPFGSALHKEDYVVGGIPVINPKHIVNQRIVPDEKTTLSNEKAEELCAYRLKSGDIVLGRRGEMGRSAPVAEHQNGWLCGTGSLIIRLQDGYDAAFYSQIIASHSSVQYLEKNSVGSTMSNLNEKIVKGLPVPNYSKEDQQRIVAILAALFEKEQRAKEAAEQVIDQIDTMKKSILARAFRGELGTNDPNDESAVELLKRVL